MSEMDALAKAYTNRSEVFADAFNFFLYDGKPVIDPEKLVSMDPNLIAIPYGKDHHGQPVQRYRDILKRAAVMEDGEVVYLLLGIENQNNVHYAMPVRAMVYDALQYARQVEMTGAQHRKQQNHAGHGRDEYLSGFYKEDYLLPVITLVIYFSDTPWDGPKSLQSMMKVKDEAILKWVQDYRINLIEPAAIRPEDMAKFRSDLGAVLQFIKYSRDKVKMAELVENDSAYRSMDRTGAQLLKSCAKLDIRIEEREEKVNMCQAIQEWMEDVRVDSWNKGHEDGWNEGHEDGWNKGHEDGWNKGHEDGWNEGSQDANRKFAIKLSKKGFTPEMIADMTDTPQEIVICWLSEKQTE